MTSVLERGRLHRGQDILEKYIGQLGKLETPPLGPQFKTLGGTALNDALVIHRMTSKFERPNARSADKTAESLRAMLEYDAQYDPKKLFKGRKTVTRFLEARAWLHKNLKGFKPRGLSFPKGEGVVSSDGYVDLYYKLTMDDHWTVSRSCFEDACKIAYNTHALKRAVLRRFRERMGTTSSMILRKAFAACPEGRHPGYFCFKRAFGHVVSIHSYSRLTTVPKNNREERVITCEPFWNMVVQRSIALGLIQCLKWNLGIDLASRQELHRSLIANREKATVDFSKASDSNWLGIFKMLFPKWVVDPVLRARTGLCEYDGEFVGLNQLAPMGCGYTFEIMTLTLLAYSRTFDKGATVFGDDVIIAKNAAQPFITFAENMGWRININKTFTEGNFSESCGGFYNHTLKSHIVSYDIKWPETYADVISSANKIAKILRYGHNSPTVRNILLLCYKDLISDAPRVVVSGVEPQDGEENAYLWALPGLEQHYSETFSGKFDGEVRKLRKHVVYVREVDPRPKDEWTLYRIALLRGSQKDPCPKRGSIAYRTIQAHT